MNLSVKDIEGKLYFSSLPFADTQERQSSRLTGASQAGYRQPSPMSFLTALRKSLFRQASGDVGYAGGAGDGPASFLDTRIDKKNQASWLVIIDTPRR